MASFEPLVRPFETPSLSPPTLGVGTIPALTPDVIFVAQGSGQMKSGGYSWSWELECYADAQQYETVEGQPQQGDQAGGPETESSVKKNTQAMTVLDIFQQRVAATTTWYVLVLPPVQNGPFAAQYDVVVSNLELPQQINLAAPASP